MLTIKRILFPTDFSRCSDQALVQALFLSHQYGAELHIVHALLPLEYDPNSESNYLPDLEKIQAHIHHLSTNQLSSVGGLTEIDQTRIHKATLRGISAAPTILEYASENDIDLIVMGTHGRRGLNHLLLGSVAEEVVRMAPCPVFTVRETKNAGVLRDFRSILVPVDYSEHSRQALVYAKHIGEQYDATLRVLHIIEEAIHPSFYATGQTALSTWYPEIESHAFKEMNRMLSEARGPQVSIELYAKEGRAASDIVTFAKRSGVSLIVMASHGLTGIEHLLLGSVTEKVVRMAPCPVFTIKSFGKSLLKEEEQAVLDSAK